MARFSASQHLRFRIRELWLAKGSKMSEEQFYQIKMEYLTGLIEGEIFDLQHGSNMTPDEMMDKVDEIFGIDRSQQYPLN